jgi:vacuolar-type H+-ATPase subunit I/STV1
MEEIKKKLDQISTVSKSLSDEIVEVNIELEKEREKLKKEASVVEKMNTFQSTKIQLDVGGQLFSTSLSTLQSVSHLIILFLFHFNCLDS